MGAYWRSRGPLTHGRILWVAASLILQLLPIPGLCQVLSPAERKALNDFSHKAKQYLSMERNLPADKMQPTADVAELEQQRVALRKAIKEARPDAKQGDFFTPSVAAAFRRLLAQTMSGPDGARIRASLAHAEPGAPANLQVNGVYPDTAGQPIQSVPPTLLMNLPVLPKGLQYTVAGKTLSLHDDAANLVVDFLPNALP